MNSHITDFLTFQCRKIFVRGLVLDCHIGAYEHEKHRTQKVTFECDVWIPLQDSTSSCVQLLRGSSAKTEAYEHVDAVGIEVWRRRPSLP